MSNGERFYFVGGLTISPVYRDFPP